MDTQTDISGMGWRVVPKEQVEEWEENHEYVIRMVHDKGFWVTALVLCGKYDVSENGNLIRKVEILTLLDGSKGIVDEFDKARKAE